MPKPTPKIFRCVHENCVFETDKRKAIVTHLLRTHSERKEDFECDYCELLLTEEKQMEIHLRMNHPSEPFRYTCVSRIEGVVQNCLKLGMAGGDNSAPAKTAKSPKSGANNSIKKLGPIKSPSKSLVQNGPPNLNTSKSAKNVSNSFNLQKKSASSSSGNSPKGKNASPSFSLGPKPADKFMNFHGHAIETPISIKQEPVSIEENATEGQPLSDFLSQTAFENKTDDFVKMDNYEDDAPREVSASMEGLVSSTPEGQPKLKIKLNLKSIKNYASLGPKSRYLTPSFNRHSGQRFKRSEPEVYHFIDRIGRRCCPFCPYKTNKNSIRVHLSGKHGLYFVQCSLCSYKGAFPHQVIHHAERVHLGENYQVIQLSKENREHTIDGIAQTGLSNPTPSNSTAQSTKKLKPSPPKQLTDKEKNICSESKLGSSKKSKSKIILAPKPPIDVAGCGNIPKCQTSKTPYYKIEYENYQYVYKCTRCSFKTPVRATIYTHKYRHEECDYKCGHCGYRSAPRSNVVFHCKSKHKTLSLKVLSCKDDMAVEGQELDMLQDGEDIMTQDNFDRDSKLDQSECMEEDEEEAFDFQIKQEPQESEMAISEDNAGNFTPHVKTIIKVPQFKRTLPPSVPKPAIKRHPVAKVKSQDGYVMSTNKLYRFNREGNPKFVCVLCPYGADTHPKMKHHLYRHRPQRYKCPYCSHRKYPRSYVVRHVRDTHKDKPLRVIDLMTSDDIVSLEGDMDDEAVESQYMDQEDEDEGNYFPEYADQKQSVLKNQELTVDRLPIKLEALKKEMEENPEAVEEEANFAMYTDNPLNPSDQLRLQISQKRRDSSLVDTAVKSSESNVDSTKEMAVEPQLDISSDKPRKKPPQTSVKMSNQEYFINYGGSPRYLCNQCDYSTDKYNTIHTHMNKHEKQLYECLYCGYTKSPRSCVESHIRDVHKGKPVIVKDLRIDVDTSKTGQDGTDHSNKRKLSVSTPTGPGSSKKMKTLEDSSETNSATPKLNFKWPAPRSKHEISVPSRSNSSSPDGAKNKSTGSVTPKNSKNNVLPSAGTTSQTVHTSKHSPGQQMANKNGGSKPSMAGHIGDGKHSDGKKIPNKGNFKTLYKCAFDPDTCHHISKDKSKMKQHLFHHVEYKPWTCNYCGMAGTQSSHVKNHIRAEHPDNELSFSYKKHNYLEKHIEGFLQKSMMTLPVEDYKAVLQRKGISRRNQIRFHRDAEGCYKCPYCEFRTMKDTGTLFDHVKNSHKKPRFRCHWCEHRAFYRSEIRKHHRREHPMADFQVDELDLTEYTDDVSDDIVSFEDSIDDFEEEGSNSPASSFSDSLDQHQSTSLTDIDDHFEYQQVRVKEEKPDYTEEPAVKSTSELKTSTSAYQGTKAIANSSNDEGKTADPFKCGHCSFSASLRMKVKLHCQNKHPEKELLVREMQRASSSFKIHGITVHPPSIKSSSIEVKLPDLLLSQGNVFGMELKAAGVNTLNLNSLSPEKFQQVKMAITQDDSLSSLESEPNEDNLNTSLNDGKEMDLLHELPRVKRSEKKEGLTISNSLSSSEKTKKHADRKDELACERPQELESDIEESISALFDHSIDSLPISVKENNLTGDREHAGSKKTCFDNGGATILIKDDMKGKGSEYNVKNHSKTKLGVYAQSSNEEFFGESEKGLYSMAKKSKVMFVDETGTQINDDEDLLFKSQFH
ncbi:hypothetical protein CHS0354_024641 [Potamilus streckersoni]|uniref:C2H2-type domain-containing protein n=1 Tax=Potamilus streckersoni TaxID=2493646 RepID=A0AAE0SWF5_9BIVA|nr:hypothetical protein CHS0354_024641 [Potamilus streckersoni]